MIYDNFIKYIDDGRKGLNRGIPMGFPRLDRYLRGIQKKRYYLIGANTGVGKTAFVDEAFILNPYEWITKTNAKEKLKVFYYSFEIDLESKLCKWVSYQIFKDHNIIIDPDHIAGMDMQHENDSENKLSDENYNLVLSYREYFETLFENIQFEDVAINPTGIKRQVEEYCKSVGKEVSYSKIVEGREKQIKYYKQDNSNEYVIVIIDHIALLKQEQSFSKKLLIDKMDEYLIELRNKYRIIPVVISQFNRELGDIQRQKFKELVPILEDFKDSGNTQESANVVIALFSPKRYNLKSYIDYDLKGEIESKQVVDYFRAMFVLKNRGGKDGVRLGMRFLGNCGYFEEIPPPKDFEKNPLWYSKIVDFSKSFLELINTKKEKQNG
jgi:hypothetical protein